MTRLKIKLKSIYRKYLSKQEPFFTNKNKIYYQYEIGDWTYGTPIVLSWGEGSTLKIGKYCSISDGVIILLGGEHRVDWVTTFPFNVIFPGAKKFTGHPKSKGNVIIHNDVWIGREALILSGVEVGNGAVIGARSVVTKNVAAYSIVAGNPAKHIRYRFNEEIIRKLEKIAWWDWPVVKIEEAWPLLLSSNIDNLLDIYK